MPARDELRVSLGSTRPWCWLGLALTAAGALELLGGALLIRALVGPPWSTALETVLAVATLALLVVLWSPLWGSLRVSGDHLVVDFGLVAGLCARLDEIESVEPFRPDALHPVPLGVDVDPELARATLSRGAGGGYLLIRASAPQPMRHQVCSRANVRTAVVRVADPAWAAEVLTMSLRQGG
jgi:hypothetical protein